MLFDENEENKNSDIDILNCIYQNAKIGGQNITQILPKINDNNFQKTLLNQLTQYKEVETQASEMLLNFDINPKENMINKFANKTGVAINTLTNSSTSHIAEMMITENITDIINLTKKINENIDCQKKITDLGDNLIKISEKNVENLKNFL